MSNTDEYRAVHYNRRNAGQKDLRDHKDVSALSRGTRHEMSYADSIAATAHLKSIGRKDPGTRELMARSRSRFVSRGDEF